MDRYRRDFPKSSRHFRFRLVCPTWIFEKIGSEIHRIGGGFPSGWLLLSYPRYCAKLPYRSAGHRIRKRATYQKVVGGSSQFGLSYLYHSLLYRVPSLESWYPTVPVADITERAEISRENVHQVRGELRHAICITSKP